MVDPNNNSTPRGFLSKLFSMFSCAINAQPANPNKTPLFTPSPDGLQQVWMAANVAEADLLRNLLIENGFHPEHVPSGTMGVFGANLIPSVHVPTAEAEEAREFIHDYLNAPPPDESGDAS